MSTQKMTGRAIARGGKWRWRIEGFFKTAKHRFGLHRFGQNTRQGVYRWLVLSFMAFLLAHWCHEALLGQSCAVGGRSLAAQHTSKGVQ